MSCQIIDFTINGDKTGSIKKLILDIAQGDDYKALLISTYFGDEEFAKFLEANTGESDYLKVLKKSWTKLRKLTNDYFNAGHTTVKNSARQNQGNTDNYGFANIHTLRAAKDHTATTLLELMYDNVVNKNNLSNTDIIEKVITNIYNNFINVYSKAVYDGLDENHTFKKENAEKINKLIETKKKLINELNANKAEIKRLRKEKKDENKAKIKELKARNDSIRESIKYGENYLFYLMKTCVDNYGDNIAQAYGQLVFNIKINPKKWFEEVFTISKINKYKREFENTINNDDIEIDFTEDEHDNYTNENDSVDLESRRWESDTNRHTSYEQLVGVDIKLYLSTIKMLTSPKKEVVNGVETWVYDTNNPLKVPTTMGADFLINQLSNLDSYASVKDFVESIRRRATQIKGLEGLMQIVEDCEKEPQFANRLFHELANPKVNKSIIDVVNGEIKHSISNSAADPVGYVYFNLQNTAKFTMKEKFDINDIYVLQDILNKLKPGIVNAETINSNVIKNYETTLIGIVAKYFPNIDNNAITNYLHSNKVNPTENYRNLFILFDNLLVRFQQIIAAENELRAKYNKAYVNWKNNLEFDHTTPKPVFDYDSIPYDKMNPILIEISQLLTPYIAVRTELNSFNAEGNLGADLIGNNNITNLLKQINYATPENANYGLQKLGEAIVNVPQYAFSPIFWGVRDNTGKVVIPGLFTRTKDGFIVNKDAKKLLSISLFNGARNQDTNENSLYNTMSKGDYFLSNLITFFEPYHAINQFDETNLGGFFLRTPSDAPKNFLITTKVAHIDGLFEYIRESRNKYITDKYNNLMSVINLKSTDDFKNVKIRNKNNLFSLKDAINAINNIEYGYDYSGQFAFERDGNTIIPLVVKTDTQTIYIYLAGEKEENKNSIKNVKVLSSYTKNGEFTNDNKQFIAKYFGDIGMANGEIQTNINENHGLFLGFKQQLLNELNNLIFNLNNVFTRKVVDGKVIYTLKKDTRGLFDRYHFNGEILGKDGKLTGNVFTLSKLFTTNGYNAGAELLNAISLYGPGNTGIINNANHNNVTINLNNPIISEVKGELTLNTDIVDSIITEITKNWINNFVVDINNEAKQYTTIIDNRYSQSQIQDAMFNAALAEMSFDDLFEGDGKFYKNSRDFFKRAKEVQASGKTYAGFDLASDVYGEIKPILDFNGNKVVLKVNGKDLAIEDGFKAVTIRNTVRESDNANNIYNELLEVNKELPESTRKRIAYQIAKGYGYDKGDKTKVNDAQSYITIDEWIRRRYLDGTLSNYKDILDALLDPNADITKLPIDKVNKFIQVQKNFYFDKQYDSETKTVYARQIKNAEFVLIPALIKGTSLETLYNVMVNNGLGQVNTVETDKASKRAILTFWDNDGKVTQEAVDKFNNDLADKRNIESYYYRYLYKQQEVAQHMVDAKNKAGIQIMKKILDNADPIVAAHIQKFFNNYVANIKSDFRSFIKAMGWNYTEDENGNIEIIGTTTNGLNFQKFYERAKDEAARLGLDSNFMDYVTADIYGNTKMPNYMNIVSSKLESIAQAMFNNAITRQKLPGWHAAQITNVGYDSNLKYHPEVKDENGNIIKEAYAEVRIPRWSKLIPRVKPGSEEEKQLLEKMAKEGLDIHIGYRIPTEGKQSISILKVVGFLDDIQGSTIVVPDEWVTQTGSDFDVDSVYGICFEMELDPKTGELRKSKEIKGEDEDSVKRRHAKYLNAEVERLLKENKRNVYYSLSTDEYEVKSIKDINRLFASNNGINFICSQLGLIDLHEFSKLSYLEQQSKAARNNNILQAMVDILNSPTSTEENYSRSNFDDLTEAKNYIDNLRKQFYNEVAKKESIYNPLDQITFMENAMSGASLKAFSVSRDTFNSVCNYTKAKLNNDAVIYVTYDLTDTINGKPIYNYEDIEAAYGNPNNTEIDRNGDISNIVRDNNGNVIQCTVRHRMWAHSNNNRNVLGKILTVYSSETTAHILDAVKEGSIFNENQYTFGSFKTLIDLGIDYNTAIAFLQQPTITDIVNAYNETNSVYANINGNPIQIAINRLANKLGYTINGREITDNTSTFSVYKELANDVELQRAIYKLTGGRLNDKGQIVDGVITLNGKRLRERFNKANLNNNSENYDIETAAEDLLNILFFAKLRDTTNKIEKVMRCCNPDKFGAKQSIFSTRKTINNIKSYLTDETKVGNILKVDNDSLLEALYPGILKNNIDVNNSKYKYLAAFLKYSTMQSVEINSQLFPLQSEEIYSIIDAIENKMGIDFNDEQAKAFQQYIINYIYNTVPQLTTPYTVNQYGFFEPIEEDIYNTENLYWSNEIERINGYKNFATPTFSFKDINNPTDEELKQWYLLTPAQKVIYIQNAFNEDAGIFKYINVNRWKGKETLKYNDTIGDIETLYNAFSDAFFNKNRILATAALDLVKYGFIAEGGKFKKGSISKLIPNNVLLAGFDTKGLNIIETIKDKFNQFRNLTAADKSLDEIFNKFVRSHAKYIKPIYVGKKYPGSFNKFIEDSFVKEGMFLIPNNDTDEANTIRNKFGIEIDENGNITNDIRYIYLNRKVGRIRKNVLYKLKATKTGIYGIPLNTLDENEVYDYSYNNDNNQYKPEAFYDAVISHQDETGYEIPKHITENTNNVFTNSYKLKELNEQGDIYDKAMTDKLFADIADFYHSPVEGRDDYVLLFNQNVRLKSIIPYGVITWQYIDIDGSDVLVKIKRYNMSKNMYNTVTGRKDNRDKLDSAESKVVDKVLNSTIKQGISLYKIQFATNDEINKFENPNNESKDDFIEEDDVNARQSILPLIDDNAITNSNEFNSLDQVAVDMANTIYSTHRKNSTANTDKFVKDMNAINFDNNNSTSVHDNNKDVYKSASEYYENEAANLLNYINNFTLTDENGNEFHINDDEFYKLLEQNPEQYNKLVKLILDAHTFGNQFKDIFVLDLKGETEELTHDIEKIKQSVRSVKDNIRVKQAMEKIFNLYLAGIVAENPNIRHGLANIRDTFGDITKLDNLFSDIGFLDNNQVQVVVKYINSKMNEVTRFTVPELLDKFDEEYETIIRQYGNINMNHIVDENGNLIREYDKKFIEDRNTVLKNLAEARANYGVTSEQYWQAKLAKDEWFAAHTEQEFVKSYYDEKNINLRFILENAKEEFLEYQTIINELKAISGNAIELSRDQLLRRAELLNQLKFFTSKFNEDGTEKSTEKQRRLSMLKDYKNINKNINTRYFDEKIADEITNKINECIEYINIYDNNNPTKTLDEKLLDDRYKEAYEWLQFNTTYDIDETSNKALLDAYSKFINGENDKMIRIVGILKGKDVYDATGTKIDPRKISIEDMEKIKALYETEQTIAYEEDDAEYQIISPVNRKRIIGTEEYYDIIKTIYQGVSRTPAKDRYTKKINSYLVKGINEEGKFDIQLFIDNNTIEDLNTLATLVKEYNDIDNLDQINPEDAAKLNSMREKHVAKATFKAHEQWIKNNRIEKLDAFYKVFAYTSKRKKKTKRYPNEFFYGYSVPANEYIDAEKTDAMDFINRNVYYTPTREYEETKAKYRNLATARGDESVYNTWFMANHIYNSYTHRYEPLRIWQERKLKPNNPLNASYEYNPIYEHIDRAPKDDTLNTKFNSDSYDNYNTNETTYRSNVNRTAGERAMGDLFQRILDAQSNTTNMRIAARDGFMPRRAKTEKNMAWYVRQGFAALGLDYISYRDKNYSDTIDYTTDRDGDFNMINLLRKKGFVDIRNIKREDYNSDEEYNNAIVEAKENNANIDKELIDRDWHNVMKDYIEKATIYNAKEDLKYTSLLLLEDLRNHDAYKINHRNEVSISRKRSTSNKTVENTTPQLRTIDVVENWHRRFFRNEFKKKHKLNEAASLMQNMTSGKYMIFNVTGGIANIWTGLSNILGETLANDHFNNEEFVKAAGEYFSNLPEFFAEMYSEKSSKLTNALIKRFNVINYEDMSERRPDESVAEYVKRMRNLMYSFQSGGEHFMQNTVLLAMLKSHRIYEDNGKWVIGSYQNYIWNVERNVLRDIIANDNILKQQYESFVKDIKDRKEELYKYETLRKDLNAEFLRTIGDKELINDYIKAKKEALKNAKNTFKTFDTLESKFVLENGRAKLTDNRINNTQLGAFTNKVIYVNKEIHGVYDKIGAATIEREWWGAIFMQYHKHLYPGIMKRWRINGYFNEQSQSYQKGSYISLINFLTIDFDKAIKMAKDDADGHKVLTAVKGIQNLSLQILNNIHNINTNWNLMPEWERNNVKRALADHINALACITMAIGIHVAWDDKEIKDSNTISTAVYLADRLFTEAQAFTPWGAITEAKTLYSSPIASTNTPQDIIKLIGLTGNMIFDPDFETEYSTGLYKGRNKFEVLLTRNIPGVRVYNRLQMMNKSNKYYRLDTNMFKIIPVADIGNAIAGR